jgi:AraC-like DNA-binding protein
MEGVRAITFISIITFFVCILFAFFLLSIKSKNKISNKLFATYLFLNAIMISAYFHNLFLSGLTNFVIFKALLAYLQMPILYFYVMSVCYSDFKLKLRHLLHVIPYIIINIIFTPRFYSKSIAARFELWKDFNSIWEIIFMNISIYLQFVLYIILIFFILNRYKRIYQQNFSDTASKTYVWLFQFNIATAIFLLVFSLKDVTHYIDKENSLPTLQIIANVFSLIVVCWYVLKALKHPELFNSVNSKTKLISNHKEIEDTENSEEIKQLTSYMKNEKPYLNPSLSIRNLSEEIKMNSRDLSVLINQNLHQHFFDFINEYRINEAKEILRNPSKKEFTILEILYEAGFNSKSSFNTAFKKHTGLTPTEFRKTA